MEDRVEIRLLYQAGKMPIKAIVRVMSMSWNTVRVALASDRPPKYEWLRKGAVVDAVEPGSRKLLKAPLKMPATVIAEQIGLDRSVRVLRDQVAELPLATCCRTRRRGRHMRRARSPSTMPRVIRTEDSRCRRR